MEPTPGSSHPGLGTCQDHGHARCPQPEPQQEGTRRGCSQPRPGPVSVMAGCPFYLFILQAVPRGPGFEEVGDVADLAEERKAGADWAGAGRDGAAQGREGQKSPGAKGHRGGVSEDSRGGDLRGKMGGEG